MSNNANNFYRSDKVTMKKVRFKNQFKMDVVGNLFVPYDRVNLIPFDKLTSFFRNILSNALTLL